MESILTDKIQQAWNAASLAHKDQFYVNSEGVQLPYVNHIGAVAQELYMFLLENNESINKELLLISAILHDTLEDTTLTYNDIHNFFGLAVAEGVKALTKNATIEDKSLKMADSVRRILQQPREIAIVKMADRVVNLQPPPQHWNTIKRTAYLEEAKVLHAVLKTASTAFAERLEEKIHKYENYISS